MHILFYKVTSEIFAKGIYEDTTVFGPTMNGKCVDKICMTFANIKSFNARSSQEACMFTAKPLEEMTHGCLPAFMAHSDLSSSRIVKCEQQVSVVVGNLICLKRVEHSGYKN